MASTSFDAENVDSPNPNFVSEQEWKSFARKIQFSDYGRFQRMAMKSCRPRALRRCFSSCVASKYVLHRAVNQGAHDVVKFLLTLRGVVDINNIDSENKTALHYAASEGYLHIVNLLLGNKELQANLHDFKGNTPLHYAAMKGYASIVEKLLGAPKVDVNSINGDRETALHLGAAEGDAQTVELLLKAAESNPTLQDNGGNTPLHVAASRGHGVIVKMLLGISGVDVNAPDVPDEDTPLHLAVLKEHEDVVDLLLQHPEVKAGLENEDGMTPLHYAAITANESIFEKLLVARGVDVNVNGTDQVDNILHFAIRGGLENIVVKLLSQENMDPCVRSESNGETPLHVAARCGKGNIVERLLATRKVDVNILSDYNHTALHCATFRGHVDVVDILLAHPNVSSWVQDIDGDTPLHEAARLGHGLLVAKYLATKGVNVNVTNKKKETPMHLGATGGHADVVDLLLKQSCVDPSYQDCDGNSPIHVAAQNGHEGIVQILLQSPLNVDVNCKNGMNKKTPLHLCVEESHETVVDALLSYSNVDPTLLDIYGESPLHKAADKGDKSIFEKILLKAPRAVVNGTNERRDTPLHVVAREGHVDFVDLLLNEKALDATVRNRDGNIALHIAARNGEVAILEKILKRGVDVNTKGKGGATALHIAAEEGHHNVVEELLKAENVKASKYDDEGFSPLLCAASKGRDGIVKLLLSHGVDVNERRGRGGMTALAHAASSGHSNVVDILSKVPGVDPNIGSRTALVCAAKGGHIDVVEKLLAFEGINVNSTLPSSGHTALHYLVVKNGSEKILKLLLETQGIDVNSRTQTGETALHLVVKNGSKSVLELLLETQGIDVNCRTKSGETALHLALSTNMTEESSKDIVRILLKTPGIDLHIKNNVGESILFHAARNDVNALLLIDIYHASKANTGTQEGGLDKTFDLNEVNGQGDSIIHLAARNSLFQVLEFLLEVGNDRGNKFDVHKKTTPKSDAKNVSGEQEEAVSEAETAIDIAINAKNYAVLDVLTRFKSISFTSEDGEGRPTLLQGVFDRDGKDSDMFKYLRRTDQVKDYIDATYKDRQASVDAANAILVGAALIASVTFASWLQPPLGYATYYHEQLVDTFPGPPVSYPQYAAFDHHPILRMFWVCNSLSFFFAIATVISGARSVLPARKLFIKQEVLNLQRNLLITSILLGISMFFVLLAFAMAGITVLPPVLRFRANIYSTIGIGGSVCIVLLGMLVKNIIALLSEVKDSRVHRAVKSVDRFGLISRAHKAWNAICNCVHRRAPSNPNRD